MGQRDIEHGYGMGLNICYKIIEMTGGFIDVFSEGENLGSTFMFGMKMELPEEYDAGVASLVQSADIDYSHNRDNGISSFEKVLQ